MRLRPPQTSLGLLRRKWKTCEMSVTSSRTTGHVSGVQGVSPSRCFFWSPLADGHIFCFPAQGVLFRKLVLKKPAVITQHWAYRAVKCQALKRGPPLFNFPFHFCVSDFFTNHFCRLHNNLLPRPRQAVNVYLHTGAKVTAMMSHSESQGSIITSRTLKKEHRKVELLKLCWVILPGLECEFSTDT